MKNYSSNKLCSFWNSESQVDFHLGFIKRVVNSGGEKLHVKTGGDCLSTCNPSEEKAASLTAVWGNEPILLRFAKLVRDLLSTLTTAVVAAVTLIEQHRRDELSCRVDSSTPSSLSVTSRKGRNRTRLCADTPKSGGFCLHMRLFSHRSPAERPTARAQVERLVIYPLNLLSDRVNVLLRLSCQTVVHREDWEAAGFISTYVCRSGLR